MLTVQQRQQQGAMATESVAEGVARVALVTMEEAEALDVELLPLGPDL